MPAGNGLVTTTTNSIELLSSAARSSIEKVHAVPAGTPSEQDQPVVLALASKVVRAGTVSVITASTPLALPSLL